MAMKRCESGHYFDAARHTTCPVCTSSGIQVDKTAISAKPGAEKPLTEKRGAPRAAANNLESNPRIGQDTVGIMMKDKGIDPVVGWLVCVEGPERGQDFRIRAEKNFIGRSPQMDISLAGDETVSRENHLSISFNPKKNSFKLLPGESRGIVYVNDEELVGPTDLKRGDLINLGKSQLLFVPFCGEFFTWDAANDASNSVSNTADKRAKKTAG